MAQFFNAKEDIVQEAIEGLVAASGGRLARLDGFPFIRVVIRADWDKSKVAVISGGGSGHEPAHAGFVGEGMLTAAVCGDVFASPSVDAVLAAILATTGPAGCLLIVKSYTGDRLNFGLAAERARALGLKVHMLIVEDDIALENAPKPRGVAGTLFVHKLAGEVSEAGGNLEDVSAVASKAAHSVITIGMSLDTCTIPGSDKEHRIGAGKIEMGLGIHGEPGAAQVDYKNANQAISMAVTKLAVHMNKGNYAVLINNLGGTTDLEMAVLTHELKASVIGEQLTHVVGPASMMTALDMQGVSISLLPITIENELLLKEPTPVKAWPSLRTFGMSEVLPMPDGLTPVTFKPSVDDGVRALLTKALKTLIDAEMDLNALDAKVGDGDTGTTLATAASALMDSIFTLPLADHAALMKAIGQELSQTMGGSSGVLLAIFFSAAGDAVDADTDMPSALKAGLARMKEAGGAQLGDRTMVDALEPALDALKTDIGAAAISARMGAVSTAALKTAQAGRASYISADQLEGVIDPGAEAVARLFEALAT